MSALKIQLPDHERGLSPETVARWERLIAKLKRTNLKQSARQDAEREVAAIENAAHENQEAAWQKRAKAETIALALARGEEVEIDPSQVRIKNRDGLASALEVKDGLSAVQYDAGLAFRDCWEARSADVGSQMARVRNSGGEHNNDAFVFERLTRAKKLERLGSIERRVAVECRDEPACLQMLRAVAGEGHSLRTFGGGRAFARHLAALKRALDVAADL